MGIERYRAIVRLEEIRSLMEAGDYEVAKVTADSIKKERLKDGGDLFLLADVYRKSGEYDTAKEFLSRIYEKKATRRVLEELMEVCLAEKNPEEAEEYLKQYVRVSEGDPRNYIYEYRIGRQKHRPDEELLPVLQTLKAEEYTEKYAYELAKLYHKLGREQECMTECADLILWFGEGTYVERAKALQAYYRGELSADDIRVEAERRIQEAEARRAREEEERKAFEEEQRRMAEMQKTEEDASVYRFEEEEQLALEEVYRAVAEERFGSDVYEETVGEELYYSEEQAEDADPYSEVQESEELDETMSGQEALFAEVAVTESAEPMWEEDASVSDSAVEEEYEDVVLAEQQEEQTDAEAYEQISLFAPQENSAPEGTQVVTPLGKELSSRLEEKGLVFEEILHEFARIERVRKQLVRMLEVVVTVRRKCHCLIITGETKSGKTTLGTYLAKLLYELSYVKTPRVAKIKGERLNQINLFDNLRRSGIATT